MSLLSALAALSLQLALAPPSRSHSAQSHHGAHPHAHASAMHNRFHEYGSSTLRGARLQAAELGVVGVLLGARGAWALWRRRAKGARGGKGKADKTKERGGERAAGMGMDDWGEMVGRVAQVAAYVVASRAGVVRSTSMLLLAPTLAPFAPSPRAVATILLMCLLCALQAVANEDAIGALGLAVLGVSTALLAAAPRKGVPASASAAALVPVLLGVLGLLVWTPAASLSIVLVALFAPQLPLTSPASAITLLYIALFQAFALPPSPPIADLVLLVPTMALARVSASVSPLSFSFPSTSMSTAAAHPWYSPYALVPPAWRPHLATILRTPTSRKIFGFLCLNLAYMGVQMAYGVMTNSLGLISDAIHMLFDCLGLGVGLWASVAATWKPDGQYTFGYARVETLSGFANGCFLILISIFIIFEGIQRIMDPPEMETRQLLLVSSIGLAINLFGMWATGGHHHHGHSHGHDHGHGLGHAHAHDHGHADSGAALGIVHDKKNDSNGDAHAHCDHDKHEHGHDHGHDHKHDHGLDHKHDHGHDHKHEHDHHDHKHDHHDPAHSHDDHANPHSHSHDHDHHHHHSDHSDHSHGHHGHSHNMQGVFLHVMADTLGSVGVIVSTILIRWTGWTGWDPLASLFIAALILASVLPLVTDAARVLALDAKDIEPSVRAALTGVKAIEGVESYSAARFWPKGEGLVVGSIHVQLDGRSGSAHAGHGHNHGPAHAAGKHVDAARIVSRVEAVLKRGIPGLTEIVVQLEAEGFCACMTGSGSSLLSPMQ